MSTAPTWEATIIWLAHQPNGATWSEICAARKISRANWRAQVTAARKFCAEHPDLQMAIPRAVSDDGWRFRVTRDRAVMKPGWIGDDEFLLAILHRKLGELEVAYDHAVETETAGKRSVKAKHILKETGTVESLIGMLELDLEQLQA